MVKGISRRVVVVIPGPAFLSRRSSSCERCGRRGRHRPGAGGGGPRVARNYAGGDQAVQPDLADLSPAVYTLTGAAGIGLVWLTVWLIENSAESIPDSALFHGDQGAGKVGTPSAK